ncbi:hypothetical protein QO200_12985 [Flavobacterium sp. Arc3]|jgi:hypothetical protein|uniref:hypothetical protein n=1 Tax=unclassified Flavobacterium TaxID=196869 RepID=UPI00352EDDCE
MKPSTKITTLFMGLFLFSCSPDTTDEGVNAKRVSEDSLSSNKIDTSVVWNFNDLTGWEDATQIGLPNYWVKDGKLTIFTNPNTWERTKIKTLSTFTTGTYTWRVFIPEMGAGDMASIGAFLYINDTQELDFEVGYGKQITRNLLKAEPDDLIVYMTSQGNPFQSHKTKIKRGQWHTFSMELTLNSKRNYNLSWIINGAKAATTELNYGNRNKFKIFCSLENLTFMGDHIPKNQNSAIFDFVKYSSK